MKNKTNFNYIDYIGFLIKCYFIMDLLGIKDLEKKKQIMQETINDMWGIDNEK